MTTLRLTPRFGRSDYEFLLTNRVRKLRHHRSLLLIPAGIVLFLLGIALQFLLLPALSRADTVDIQLPEPLPMELFAATRGPRSSEVATGQTAQAINAGLPFLTGQIEAARPFALQARRPEDAARALNCLTQAIYYEAGYEPVEGRRAVAQVILNRMRHPAFPNTVCGVVYDGSTRPGCQFSFTCDGSLRRAPAAGAWAEAQRLAREALAGHVAPSVGYATHYHANYVSPYWAPRLTKLQQIGAHIFYRWPGNWGRSAAFSSRYGGTESVYLATAAASAATESADTALVSALPPDPTDRRAPEDVGGRLDVSRGWTLSIPTPQESGSGLSRINAAQAGPVQMAAAGGTTEGEPR
ncbi:MAG TPA: cell wall hydrolase [Gemmatimonadales bacterium]|nr:cell wall hydrolase [Gemmatimonadales bacterium]